MYKRFIDLCDYVGETRFDRHILRCGKLIIGDILGRI